jgi:hypothetical protein
MIGGGFKVGNVLERVDGLDSEVWSVSRNGSVGKRTFETPITTGS